jgi:hypothetical protein
MRIFESTLKLGIAHPPARRMNIEDIRLRFVKECTWQVVSTRMYVVYWANTSPVRESVNKAIEQTLPAV